MTIWLRRGFTLIELLVVIAVIGLLAALLLAAIVASHQAARRTQCSSQMAQLGLSLMMYHESHDSFPPSVLGTSTADRLHTWLVFLLPHGAEQKALFDQYNFEVRFNHAANATVAGTAVAQYMCPAADSSEWYSPQFSPSNYAANSGTQPSKNDGVLYPGSATRKVQVTDGLSHTIALGELFYHNLGWARGSAEGTEGGGGGSSGGFGRGVSRWWKCASACAVPGINPRRTSCDSRCEQRFQFSSAHAGGAMFTFADAHVEFLSDGMDANTFRDLLTRTNN